MVDLCYKSCFDYVKSFQDIGRFSIIIVHGQSLVNSDGIDCSVL